MSDLEPSSSRAQSAAPITQLAAGKLRALSASSSPFAESDGLLDAFAEVFARMAVASPPPVQNGEAPTDESGHEVAADDRAEATTAETTNQNEGDHSNSGDEIDADPVQIFNQAAELATPTDEVEVDFDVDQSQSDAEVIEQDILDEADPEQLILKPQTETERAETVEQVEDAAEIIAPLTTAASDQGHQRQDRRDSQQVLVTNGTEITNVRGESENQSDAVAPHEVSLDQVVSETSSDSDERSDENRRGRTRRSGRGEKNSAVNESPTQRFADQSRTSRQGEVAPAKPETTEWAAEATRTQDVSTANVPKTPTGANAAATAIAAKAAGSANTATSAASNVRGGASGSTQPIDPATSTAKTQPQPKTNVNEPQGQTSDLVSRAKLIQRVSKAFQHLGPDGGQVRIRLAPPDLGTVRVEMRIQQRRIQARVIAESEAASNALREHLPDLRARLESQGMQIDKIEVETETGDNVGSQLGDARSHGDTRGQQSFGRRPRQPSVGLVSQSVSQLATAPEPEFVNRSTAGVDVRL